MKALHIILLALTCFISSNLMGQSYTVNQLIGTWDFLTIGGQAAPAGAQLVLEAIDKGTINVGGGLENITYKLDNGVLYLNTTSIGNVEMEILKCQDNLLNMKDKSNGTVVELKKKVPTMADPRDGEIYETVVIGNQTWMAENLRYNAPGSMVNTNSPGPKYGRLYDWVTVFKACPTGWHLPSDAEWNTLEVTLGLAAAEAGKLYYRGSHGAGMKSATGWNKGGNGDNSSGFNVFPAGYSLRSTSSETYLDLGEIAHFWSASEKPPISAWDRYFSYENAGVFRYANNTLSFYSCRCVKD
jgi:uncharacterized protein (TIGR02145 family)